MFSNGSMFSKFNMFDIVVNTLSWIRISIDADAHSYDKLRVATKQTILK